MSLDLFSPCIGVRSVLNSIRKKIVQFQKEILMIRCRGSRSPETKDLVISRCCSAEDG